MLTIHDVWYAMHFYVDGIKYGFPAIVAITIAAKLLIGVLRSNTNSK